MTPTLFSDLGLSPELERAISKLGFEQASPIQAASIPVLMQGKDVVGQSQTGSGKTAAFAIPAIERTDSQEKVVQVLTLCPTRELAVQVSEEVHKLACFKRGIMCLPIYGGQSYERQFAGLKQGAQIVIGTPGRVMDHLRRGTLQLDRLRSVILDEADVMLDMGFREDIETILQSCPEQRQTVFFSATMPREIRQLIETFAREPESIQIEQKAMTVPTVEQTVFEVDRRLKLELLTRLIDVHDIKLGIIFCNTKAMVDNLVEHLVAQGYQADRLHGDMTQGQRDRVMNRFRKSGLEFLVATDVAARGIDVNDVEAVFNYDIPYDPEDYVHRIGRTGRAGRSGVAFSFVAGREVFKIRDIERYTRTAIRYGNVPSLQDVDAARSGHVLKRVRDTLQAEEYKAQNHLVERLLEEGFATTEIASALLHLLQDGEATGGREGERDELTEFSAERARWRERKGSRGPRESRGPRAAQDRSRNRREGSFQDRFKNARSSRGRSGEVIRMQDDGRGRPQRSSRGDSRSDFREFSDRRGRERSGRDSRAEREPRSGRESRYGRESKPGREGRPRQEDASSREGLPPSLSQKRRSSEDSSGEGAVQQATSNPAPRASDSGRTRLRLGIGREAGVTEGQIRDAVLGETGISAGSVGRVELQDRFSVVEVSSEQARSALTKIKRANIAGKRVKAKLL